MFEKIYGYESQKREIEEVINWFIDRKKYQKEGITVPKGVILHGAPGCGKTLFMKEISEKYADMVVSIDGVSEQLNEEVEKAFESIPENGRIVLIDELDLLLDKDSHLTRVLQTKMDGLMSNGNVLVIATANRLHDINDALLRAGRFDRDLKMGHPDLNDKMEILNNSLLKYKVRLQDCDIKYLATIMTNVSCAEIVSIVNDAMLRNNGQTITSVMIEDSYYRSYYGEEFKKKDNSVAKYIAMHEAGHALITYKNREYFNLYKITVQKHGGTGGLCKYYQKDENDSSLKKVKADIEMDVAGYLANKIMFNHMDSGSMEDLRDAIFKMRVLVNSLGYKGIKHILREYGGPYVRNETEKSCYKNELIVRKELRKIEREVTRYIIKNKRYLVEIANKLEAQGQINQSEFEEIFSVPQNKMNVWKKRKEGLSGRLPLLETSSSSQF